MSRTESMSARGRFSRATAWVRGATLALGTAALALASPREAAAQAREPLCVYARGQRLLSGPGAAARGLERLVLEPRARARAGDEQTFVLAVRDRGGSLRAASQRPHGAGRPLDEMNYARQRGASDAREGLTVLLLDAGLAVRGEAIFLPDPVAAPGTGDAPVAERSAAPVGVSLPGGVLVLQRLGPGDLYAAVVPVEGRLEAPQSVFTAPAPQPEGDEPPGARGVAWFTAAPVGDGALALAGLTDGRVFALRFDRAGRRVGEPVAWAQRVGGPLELMPTARGAQGPVAALLGRPVRGTGPYGEQARVQVMLALDPDTLQPQGLPAATGFAQFPLAAAARGRTLAIVQWAQEHGLAIAQLTVGDRRVAEALPRVYRAEPPLEGLHLGHDLTLGAANVLYDVAVYGEGTGGGLHGHLAWIPPSGAPYIRRDVLPARMHLSHAPRVLPAEDGVVLVLAGQDETGSAVDAFHLRCDLVSLPAAGAGAGASEAPATPPAPAPAP